MVIENPKMKSFIESNVSNDFGLTVDEVAQKCRNYGRFSAWLNGNVESIKEVLNAVKNVGVSPAFFASYERTEGYNSSWGWLNHTTQQGGYLNDAKVTAQWIVSQSKNTTDNPAWIDYANYKDFVPSDVKQAGNSHFSTLPLGTIGKVVIAGTAAATWEVYYPQGLLAEYNGVQNYGTPINHMIQYIEEWGGTISGGSGGEPNDGSQLAVFPADYIEVTQGEYGSFSHYAGSSQELAIDFVFPTTRYPLYAPFDSEVIDVFPEYAQVNWRSTVKVTGADGSKHEAGQLIYIIVHDHDFNRWSVGDTIKKGEHVGNSGNAGFSTADHLHLQVIKGSTHPWPTPVSVQLHICDIFATNHVNIVNGGGYDWKESDFIDGDDGGGTDPDEPDKKDDWIDLLIVNAVNGWYN